MMMKKHLLHGKIAWIKVRLFVFMHWLLLRYNTRLFVRKHKTWIVAMLVRNVVSPIREALHQSIARLTRGRSHPGKGQPTPTAVQPNSATHEQRESFAPTWIVPAVVAGLCLFIFLAVFMFKPEITGLVTLHNQTTVDTINLTFAQDGSYPLQFNESVRLTAITISGSVLGNGSARVLLNNQYLVFDTATGGIASITGLVVGNESTADLINESVSIASNVSLGDNTTGNQSSTFLSSNESIISGSFNESVDGTPPQSSVINDSTPLNHTETNETSNKTISITVQYIPNAFDPDNDGVAAEDDAIDIAVNASFTFAHDESALCTRFEVYSEDTEESTFVCQGAADCCGFVGLAPISEEWDVYYSYYGKDGATAHNVISAAVIHYAVSLEALTADIVSSDAASLSAQFLPVVHFENVCRETCSVAANGSSFTLDVTVDNAILHIDSIAYTIEKTADITPPNPVTNLRVLNNSGQIVLIWDNPEEDFAGVTILRTEGSFPSSNYSLVDLAAVTDVTSLMNDSSTLVDTTVSSGVYYYNFYSYDKSENYARAARIVVEAEAANQKPVLITSIPDVFLAANASATIVLGNYFTDPGGDRLTFTARQPDNVSIAIAEGLATITPDVDFFGERFSFFTAADGVSSSTSNIFTITVTAPNQTLNASVQQPTPVSSVEINKPVQWVETVDASAGENITLAVPPDILSATVIVNGTALRKDLITITHNGTVRDLEAFEAEKKLEQVRRRLALERGFIGISAARQALLAEKTSLEGLLDRKSVAGTEDNTTSLTIENVRQAVINYTTQGPTSIEETVALNKKRITVDAAYRYTNVLTHTEIAESAPESIRLYWFASPTDYRTYVHNAAVTTTLRVDITDNPAFNVTFIDTNTNGLIDRIEWVTPHLSNQSFEVELSILTVQSYPTLFGNWTVQFNASGTANLTISASNGTTFTEVFDDTGATADDLETVALVCGNETLFNKDSQFMRDDVYFILENGSRVRVNETINKSLRITSLFVEDYTCSELSNHTVRVITGGKHTQEYRFGGITAYAFNLVEGQWGGLSGGRGSGFELITGAVGFIGATAEGGGYNSTVHATEVTNNASDSSIVALLGYIYTLTATGTNLTISETLNVTVVEPSESVRVFGQVQLSNNTNISGAGVTINHTSITDVTTNASGEYNHTFTAPSSDGVYLIKVNTSHVGESASNSVELTVDGTAPTWSNNQTNSTAFATGETVQFNVTWQDAVTLSHYVFSWNDTGSWVNVSSVSISGTSWTAVENQTITAARGTDVYWKYYANDSLGHWNETDEFRFTAGNAVPTHTRPILNATDHPVNQTTANLTAFNQSTVDSDNDPVFNLFKWYENNVSMAKLILTFNHNNSNSTGVTKDYSGFDHEGEVIGAAWNASGVNGSGTYIFDGVDDRINLSNASGSIIDSLNFTISLWVKRASSDINEVLLSDYDGSGPFLRVLFFTGNRPRVLAEDSDGDTIQLLPVTALQVGVWHHLGIVRAEDQFAMYIDGAEVQTANNSALGLVGSKPFSLGVDAVLSSEFSGSIDEVYIFDRSFSGEQVVRMYEAGAYGHSVLVSNETSINRTYIVEVTPNDGLGDGVPLNSTPLTILGNAPPSVTNVIINSTDDLNRTNGSLVAQWTFSDVNGDPAVINETRWYNESAEITAFANLTTIGAANTVKGQNWTLSVRSFDGAEYSPWVNSSVFIVQNTVPSIPVLFSPINNANLTDRTPDFIWNASLDNDVGESADNITYEILVDCSTCPLINQTNISLTNFTPSSDLDLDVVYNWTVRAYDGEDYSSYSQPQNFTVISVSIITLNGTVNFTSLVLGQIDDTDDNDPGPFVIENDGNVNVNIRVYAQQALWIKAALNTSSFQFKADNTSERDSFNENASVTSYTNITGIDASTAVEAVKELNYFDLNDTVEIDIRVDVPLDEPSGSRSTVLVFEAIAS